MERKKEKVKNNQQIKQEPTLKKIWGNTSS
jgi:hypothetical protein